MNNKFDVILRCCFCYIRRMRDIILLMVIVVGIIALEPASLDKIGLGEMQLSEMISANLLDAIMWLFAAAKIVVITVSFIFGVKEGRDHIFLYAAVEIVSVLLATYLVIAMDFNGNRILINLVFWNLLYYAYLYAYLEAKENSDK